MPHERLKALTIIAVDWGKDTLKRSAYKADLTKRTISRLQIGGKLSQLIEYASSLAPPVLIGVDAAIGFPAEAWARLAQTRRLRSENFIDFLLDGPRPPGFFSPVSSPEDWSPLCPFIRPAAGPWSLNEYIAASGSVLYRQIDRRLKGKPIFLMSGIPGTVGSGTRALWQELIALQRTSAFRVWPFHGSMGTLLNADGPVIAEIYPKACYGIALAETLPADLLSIPKTKECARLDIVRQLRDAPWVARQNIAIEDWRAAEASEDDFDALLSAAALMRIVVEDARLEGPEDIEATIEGSVVGAASLTASTPRVVSISGKPSAEPKRNLPRVEQVYHCPIEGCSHVFQSTRGGWDAHVASVPRHPRWHPDVRDPAERKQRFRNAFPDWFRI